MTSIVYIPVKYDRRATNLQDGVWLAGPEAEPQDLGRQVQNILGSSPGNMKSLAKLSEFLGETMPDYSPIGTGHKFFRKQGAPPQNQAVIDVPKANYDELPTDVQEAIEYRQKDADSGQATLTFNPDELIEVFKPDETNPTKSFDYTRTLPLYEHLTPSGVISAISKAISKIRGLGSKPS